MSRRPIGVTILAVLAAIGGLLMLLAGGFSTFMGPLVGSEMARQSSDPSSAVVGGAMALMGVAMLMVGLLQLVTAYGLFTLKGWAWLLAVVLQVLSLVLNGIQAARGEVAGPIGAMLIAAVILFYLFRPHVRAAFGRA